MVVFVLFTGISVLALRSSQRQAAAIPDDAQRQATAILDDAQRHATASLDDAQREATRILVDARKKAENARRDLLAASLEGLKECPMGEGWVEVNKAYLASFQRAGDVLEYKLHNRNKYGNVKPHFALIFYDDNGVTTGIADVYWLVQTVAPNEDASDKQVINGPVSSRPSKYFRVEFH
ncbi:MAG: hypothetical protein ACLQNE_25640 [Thermoguttaceae bacterium]